MVCLTFPEVLLINIYKVGIFLPIKYAHKPTYSSCHYQAAHVCIVSIGSGSNASHSLVGQKVVKVEFSQCSHNFYVNVPIMKNKNQALYWSIHIHSSLTNLTMNGNECLDIITKHFIPCVFKSSVCYTKWCKCSVFNYGLQCAYREIFAM